MRREEAWERVPLLAGGDLEPAEAKAVRAAIAGDAEAEAELAEFEALDALLVEGLAPAAEEPSWLAGVEQAEIEPGPATQFVRRQCPFCHDALDSEQVVFCASCATPHHEPCFGENRGCALLGCGGTESVASASARTSRVCEGCEQHTPAGAPFCAWCGTALSDAAPPRHQRVLRLPARREGLGSFLAAAALLLVAGLGVGALFGAQQGKVLSALAESQTSRLQRELEQQVRELLLQVFVGQEAFREGDLDGDGREDLPESLDELRRILKESATWLPDTPAIDGELLRRVSWNYELHLRSGSAGGDPKGGGVLLALPKPRGARWTEELRAYVADEAGRVSSLDEAQARALRKEWSAWTR